MKLHHFAGDGQRLYVCLRGCSKTAEEKLKVFMGKLSGHIVYGTFIGNDSEQNRCVKLGGNAEAKLYEHYGEIFAGLLDKYAEEQKVSQIIMLGCSVGSTILQWAYENMKNKHLVKELVCCAPKFCVTKRENCYLFWNEDDDKILFDIGYHEAKFTLVKPRCFTYLTGGHDFPVSLFDFDFIGR